MTTLLVTGGAGFIGSSLVTRALARHAVERVITFDALTYAGSERNLEHLPNDGRSIFVKGDITDRRAVEAAFATYQPDVVFALAAESHVDRSIDGPLAFVHTNVVGTCTLLEAARAYFRGLSIKSKERFRFLQISTDEVYGSLGSSGAFTEESQIRPNSPYSASKAASDHFVRAYHHTYGLPTILTHCSNNYGPRQFPEKLIPLMILNALEGKPLPVYGRGENIRDWIHVEDHCDGLLAAWERGVPGQTYDFGGRAEQSNLALVQSLCDLLDQVAPPRSRGHTFDSYRSCITFVSDRPGHDFRYAIDSTKAERELGFCPKFTLQTGLAETVAWYVEHGSWVASVAADARARIGVAS